MQRSRRHLRLQEDAAAISRRTREQVLHHLDRGGNSDSREVGARKREPDFDDRADQVTLRLKKAMFDGTTEVAFAPVVFLRRPAAAALADGVRVTFASGLALIGVAA